jgi:acyl-phosphate glycerol 3-phosphate acyltransferase
MSAAPFLVVVAAAAYLVGAVPFGYLVARARGVDILRHGSGNIGATNVGRVLGRRYGILVFVLDFAKGALPALAAGAFALAGVPVHWAQVTGGIAAFLGHLYPVYLGFRGGKGVATGAGAVAVLAPGPTAAALLVWLTVAAATRYVSLASLAAAAALCGLRLVQPEPWAGPRGIVTGFCLVAAALVAVRHRANVGRLLRGNENRLKEGPAMLQLAKMLHVLAVGLWFGTAFFFTVMGLEIFGTFEQISERPASERPAWLPLPSLYVQPPPSPRFPDPLRKEQGTRVAGAVVGPLFPVYFGIQAVCGVIALVTAFVWTRRGGPATLRWSVLAVAVTCVAAGWILERKVSDLRIPRDEKTDELLRNTAPSDTRQSQVAEAEAARRVFVQWHLGSVLLNLFTLGLVAVAMALTAWLPGVPAEEDRRTDAGTGAVDGTASPAGAGTPQGR